MWWRALMWKFDFWQTLEMWLAKVNELLNVTPRLFIFSDTTILLLTKLISVCWLMQVAFCLVLKTMASGFSAFSDNPLVVNHVHSCEAMISMFVVASRCCRPGPVTAAVVSLLQRPWPTLQWQLYDATLVGLLPDNHNTLWDAPIKLQSRARSYMVRLKTTGHHQNVTGYHHRTVTGDQLTLV